jgi:hypothetical protein
MIVDSGSYGHVTTTQFASVWGSGGGPNPYSVMQVRASDGVSGLGMQAFTGTGTLYGNTAITFRTGSTIRDKDVPTGGATRATLDSTGLTVVGNVGASGVTITGSLVASGPGDFDGGLQSTPIGNVAPSTALFTTVGASGNTTVSALTVNNTATFGSTVGITGNVNGSSITLTGSLRATGPGDFDGGLQSTPIGNASASTGNLVSKVTMHETD